MKGDSEKLYSAFYKCISDVEYPFGEDLNTHASLFLRLELGAIFLVDMNYSSGDFI